MYERFKKAKIVLNHVKKIFNKLEDINTTSFAVDCYSNCREQGFIIISYDNFLSIKQAIFSENRSSDDIVVYTQNSFSDNLPTDEAYKNRKYFKHNQYEKAAIYIVNFLIEK